MGAIAVLFVTSQSATRDRVLDLLQAQQQVRLLPNGTDDARALLAIEVCRPDVVLIDATSNDERALQLISGVARLSAATKVLLLYLPCTEERVASALARGGCGCLDLRCTSSELVRAIQVVHAGELWASRRAVALAFRQAHTRAFVARQRIAYGHLSRREAEIVEWMQCGLTNKEIARKLGISDMTVKTHAQNIFHKLEVSGRLRLIGWRNEIDGRPHADVTAALDSASHTVPGLPPANTSNLKPAA